MRKLLSLTIAIAGALFAASPAGAFDKPIRFWNLTANTINQFYLSRSGANSWGENLTKNDADGSVDHDERLKLPTTKPGYYDVKFTDVKGRTCIVANVKITEGKVFSIEEKELKDCKG